MDVSMNMDMNFWADLMDVDTNTNLNLGVGYPFFFLLFGYLLFYFCGGKRG